MHTVIVNRYGGPEVLEVVEVPTPEPGAGHVRVAVRAAAVNPVDPAMAAGGFRAVIGEEPFPLGFGWDVAGVVDAVGPGVTGVAVGDDVVGLRDEFVGPTGTHATHVVLPADAVVPAPAGVDPIAASTFPLNSLTALQALDLLGLEAGGTVVVTGAAGGVGDYLVVLGARRGLRVIGVARVEDEAGVRASGAAEFVPRDGDLAAGVRALLPDGADGLVDAAQLATAAIGAVRDGGAFVAVTDPSEPGAERSIRVATVHVHHDRAQQTALAQGAADGWLPVRVAGVFGLDDAAKAYELATSRGLRGRVVLTP